MEERSVEIELPRKTSAAIAMIAMSERINAYSARPRPASSHSIKKSSIPYAPLAGG